MHRLGIVRRIWCLLGGMTATAPAPTTPAHSLAMAALSSTHSSGKLDFRLNLSHRFLRGAQSLSGCHMPLTFTSKPLSNFPFNRPRLPSVALAWARGELVKPMRIAALYQSPPLRRGNCLHPWIRGKGAKEMSAQSEGVKKPGQISFHIHFF